MATAMKATGHPKPLPLPNNDFYELAETLPAEELAVVKQVRAFMETKVAPIITKYWVDDAFPVEILPALKQLNIRGPLRLAELRVLRGHPDRARQGRLAAAENLGKPV